MNVAAIVETQKSEKVILVFQCPEGHERCRHAARAYRAARKAYMFQCPEGHERCRHPNFVRALAEILKFQCPEGHERCRHVTLYWQWTTPGDVSVSRRT